jgi:isochorismate synthase
MAMPGELFVPNVTISQFREGSTFVTTAQGTEPWESLIANQGLELQAQQPATSLQYQPMPEVYAHTVAKAVESLRRHELEKVVLARSISGTVGEQIDTGSIAQRLKLREPICTVYSLPVEGERRFTGASPELLVSRIGGEVECHPLAGTIALPADSNANDYESWLLGSAKNQREHQLMTDEIIANLKPLYSLNHDAAPSIVRLKSVAHLGTWIRGAFRNEGTAPNALDVLRSLHPTPAVGGIPRVEATELIHELEQRDRGHYAGPLGWIDESGDGDWWVGIRGVLTQGNAFEAWAGAGIVSESDPFSEREETKDKIASFLDAVLLENL